MRKKMITLLLLALVTALGAAPAHAVLQARSQVIDPATGYPTWYQDTNGLALTNCLDQNGFCIAAFTGQPLPADKALISAANFPVESFYYSAFAAGTSPGGINVVNYRADLEGGFAAAVVDGGQAVFSRIRIRIDVPVIGQYVVTHPYGVETFQVDALVPGNEINFTNDVPGLVAGAFDAAVTTPPAPGAPVVGPTFLTAAATPGGAPLPFVTDLATGSRYLASPIASVAVTGSPFGTNFVRVVGPLETFQIDTFNLQGKVIGLEVTPSPVSVTATVGTIPPVVVPVTVTNLTNAAITFPTPVPPDPGALVIAGVNAADFTLVNNTCNGATLLAADPAAIPAPIPAGTCTVGVQFDPAPSTVAARTATLIVTPPVASGFPPVPVTLNGTAQFALTLNVTGGANGTVTNADGSPVPVNPDNVNAGSNRVYKVTANAGPPTFLPLVKVDGVRQVVAADGTVTIPTIGAHMITDVNFLRAGDVDQDGGAPDVDDALQALRISVGIIPTPADDQFATADVGPLVSNVPKGNGKVSISDVMLILRRAVGLAPLW